MPKILLFGSEGQIGWELAQRLSSLGPVQAFCRPDVDFLDLDGVVRLIRKETPELIVNAVAYTAVDRAERESDVAQAVNAVAPGVLADEAKRLGAIFVHFSTDYVFDGRKRAPYSEADAPVPLNVYAQTKLEGDRAVLAVGESSFVFRTSWVYGGRGRNFFMTVSRLLADQAPLRIVNDQVGSPTWCRSVAEAAVAVLETVAGPNRRFNASEVGGLYHMACGGQTSWFEFAKAFLPPGTKVTPIPSQAYAATAKRPPYSALDSSLLARTFGVAMPPWQAALTAFLATVR